MPKISEKEPGGGPASHTFLSQMFPSGWTWPHRQFDNSGSGRKSEQQKRLSKLLHHELCTSGMLSSCALVWSDAHYLQWHLIDSKWHGLRVSHGGWFGKGQLRTISHSMSGAFAALSEWLRNTSSFSILPFSLTSFLSQLIAGYGVKRIRKLARTVSLGSDMK